MELNNHLYLRKTDEIADWLLLNGTLVDCPGLIHGKMGIAIFFFHYADFTKNELYDNYRLYADTAGKTSNQPHSQHVL